MSTLSDLRPSHTAKPEKLFFHVVNIIKCSRLWNAHRAPKLLGLGKDGLLHTGHKPQPIGWTSCAWSSTVPGSDLQLLWSSNIAIDEFTLEVVTCDKGLDGCIPMETALTTSPQWSWETWCTQFDEFSMSVYQCEVVGTFIVEWVETVWAKHRGNILSFLCFSCCWFVKQTASGGADSADCEL